MTAQPLAFVDRQAINIDDMPGLLAEVGAALSSRRGFTLFTLNLDHLVKRRRDRAFHDVYARATFVTADGWPVVRLARRRFPRMKRTAGADLVVPLCALAAGHGVPVAFYGSTQDILDRAAERLQRMYPALDIVLRAAPPFGFDPCSADGLREIARIRASGARLCFVALGAPKQELFADRALGESVPAGFVCIGAGLDFIAGAQVRAPALVQALRLEWMWRLASHPRRLGPRYMQCALLYLRLLAGTEPNDSRLVRGGRTE